MELKKGEIFHNQYELTELQGIGGFAEVWSARMLSTQEVVALKIFVKIDEAGAVEASDEFDKSVSLNHSNLVKVRHFDISAGQPYLVMEYYEGGDATSLIAKIDESRLLLLIKQVAEGLSYLHGLEPPVVHRDIKPDNILIDKQGDFYLSDLGISQSLKRTMTRSISDRKKTSRQESEYKTGGETPMAYHPPEFFGKDIHAKSPTKAHDIFAFGVCMFEIACGQLPFGEFGGLVLSKNAEDS